MGRKSCAQSQPEEMKGMRSADIKSRLWTEQEFLVIRQAAQRQAAGDDSRIDLTAIPRLMDEQLNSMMRLRDICQKVAVGVRHDSWVLDWLKAKNEGL